MEQYLEVTSLDEVLEPSAGQIVYIADNDIKTFYRYDPIEGWKPLKLDGGINMNAYDMNKQIISQLPTLTNKQLHKEETKILKYVNENNNTYFMLLCKELNYYTVLVHNHPEAKPIDYIEKVCIECAQYLGDIKAIDTTDGGIEIWIMHENQAYVMYFFAYDNGVELCR